MDCPFQFIRFTGILLIFVFEFHSFQGQLEVGSESVYHLAARAIQAAYGDFVEWVLLFFVTPCFMQISRYSRCKSLRNIKENVIAYKP